MILRGDLVLRGVGLRMPSWAFWTAGTGWDTSRVVFVADDLAAWLVSLLAAGRKKLTTVVSGYQ